MPKKHQGGARPQGVVPLLSEGRLSQAALILFDGSEPACRVGGSADLALEMLSPRRVGADLDEGSRLPLEPRGVPAIVPRVLRAGPVAVRLGVRACARVDRDRVPGPQPKEAKPVDRAGAVPNGPARQVPRFVPSFFKRIHS